MCDNFPGIDLCGYSDAGLSWVWPWREAKPRMASWSFCWNRGRSWDDVSRLMLTLMVVGKDFEEVVFDGFRWVAAAGRGNEEPRLTWAKGGCCCSPGLWSSLSLASCVLVTLKSWSGQGTCFLNKTILIKQCLFLPGEVGKCYSEWICWGIHT